MTRAGREGSPHIVHLASRYVSRLAARLQQTFREGAAAGDFRRVDAQQFAVSLAALNVFYFVAAPMFRAITGLEPFTPERIAARRAAVLDLVSHALFTAAPRPRKARGSRSKVRMS